MLDQKYRHLNKVFVSADALIHNHQVFKKLHSTSAICPVLKSNAYGHGLTVTAPVFDSLQAPFLVVNTLAEAYALQDLHVKTPILILGYTDPENLKHGPIPFTFVVFDWEFAVSLNTYQPGSKIHIFVDTGMHREGIQLSQLNEFLQKIKTLKNITVDGICSHFSDADNPNNIEFTKIQMKNFEEAVNIVEGNGFSLSWKHIAASSGTIKIDNELVNMYRVGLASYGIHPLEKNDEHFSTVVLRPALRFVATLTQLKEIQAGETVGYNNTFTAQEKMKIGLVSAGYFEGIDRRLSNKGVLKVGGVFCPILGRVSMNMSVIDVSQVADPFVGQECEIFSAVNDDENSLYTVAHLIAGIPYDLAVHIAESVKRELI